MKNIAKISTGLLAVVLFISSCTKSPSDNIPGEWDVTQTVTFFGFPIAVTGDASFKEDGTGHFTWEDEDGTDESDFTWSATDDQVTIVTVDDGETETIVLDIDTNEKDKQEWSGTMTEEDEDFGITTIAVKLTMTRK